MQKTCVIYCRQSSGKEEDSESIASQTEICKKYARSRGMKVIGVFEDPNTSGRLYPTGAEDLLALDIQLQNWLKENTSEKRFRPGLGKAFALLPKVDYLLIHELTRLYRSVQTSFLQSYINQRIAASGAKLISVKEGEIDFNDFTDTLVCSIQSQVNDNQIAMTREKSKLAMAKIQDDGYYSTMPKMYGVRYLGGRERSIEIIPEKGEVIQYVFKRILERCRYTELLRELNTHFRDRVDGKCFYDSSWRHIIANPFYCGYMYDTHGALIPAKQMQGKELVTFEDWKKANEILKELRGTPTARTHAIHPFSGLMYCGNCKGKMSIVQDGEKIGYSCLQGVNTRHDDGCRKSRTNINLIRQADDFTGLREAIAPLLPLALYKELERKSGTKSLRKTIAEKEIQVHNYQERLSSLVNAYAENETSSISYRAAYEKINERLTRVKNDLLELNKELEASGDLAKKADEYFKILPKVMKNQLPENEFTDLLHRSVNKIFCYEDKLEIQTVYGDLVLERYMSGKFRNFPKFTYKIESIGKNKSIKNLNDCRINVTYLYDKEKTEKLVVDLSVMRIYKK